MENAKKAILLAAFFFLGFFLFLGKMEVQAEESEIYYTSFNYSDFDIYIAFDSATESIQNTYVFDTPLSSPLNYSALYIGYIGLSHDALASAGTSYTINYSYSVLINGVEYPVSELGGWLQPTDNDYIFPTVTLRTYVTVDAWCTTESAGSLYLTLADASYNCWYQYCTEIPAYVDVTVIDKLNNMITLLRGIYDRHNVSLTVLGDGIGAKIDDLKSVLSTAFTNLQSTLQNQIIDLRDTLNSTATSTLGVVRSIYMKFNISLSALSNNIKGYLESLGGDIGNKLDEMIDILGDGYKNDKNDETIDDIDIEIDDYIDLEGELVDGLIDDLDEIDIPTDADAFFGANLVSALGFSSDILQAVYNSLGSVKLIIRTVFLLTIGAILLGLKRF